jgi:hypothetical protein
MRRAPIGVTIALASAALAHAEPPATVWSDWVGEWSGKLKWQGCTIDGATEATLPIDATDGTVAIDLANASTGLFAMPLVEGNAAWFGHSGDVTVHAARGKQGALDLTVELESGCQLHASLRRAGSGIAACDRLAAWARVEARCTKLSRPPLEEPARLARQRSSWGGARGEQRELLAAQCDARASRLEAELVAAGCAPNPDPAIGLRGTECQALRQATSRLARCASVPSDDAAALAAASSALAGAAQGARDADLPFVEAQCHTLRDRITAVAREAGCPF